MPRHYKISASLLFSLIALATILGFDTQSADAKSPQQITPVPFKCEGKLYQVISGQLYALDTTSGDYDRIGDPTGFTRINAMGYNLNDNFLYALSRAVPDAKDVNNVDVSELDIIKIDANGNVFHHLNLDIDSIGNSVVGDIVDNQLWILSGRKIHIIDLDGGGVETRYTTKKVPILDWGYIDGKFYGVDGDDLYVVNGLRNPAGVRIFEDIDGLQEAKDDRYGAVYVFDTDDLYVSSNEGGLYQIKNYDEESPQAFKASDSRETNQNDGASCPDAKIELPPECGPKDIDTDGDGLLDSDDIDNDNDGILDNTELELSGTGDTDGDQIPDMCDLDSDNDGLSDLVESGTTMMDQENDGFISRYERMNPGNSHPDRDNDGLMDVFDRDTRSRDPDKSQGTIPINTDRDRVEDFIDLDSDADGIPDAVEGKPTVNFELNYFNDGDVRDDDSDGDGVIDVFENRNTQGRFGGNFETAEDTDKNGSPDYLDSDSDGDTLSDKNESGLRLSGIDANGDGIDDGVNRSDDYRDNNGVVNSTRRDLLDTNRNAGIGGGDVDFREKNFDLGDALNPYDGASNKVSNSIDLWMGSPNSRPDIDETIFTADNALGDDVNGIDDEDGVTWFGSESRSPNSEIVYFPRTAISTGEYTATVDVYNNQFSSAYLQVWIDFNGDGKFGKNNNENHEERVHSKRIYRSPQTQQSIVSFSIPSDAACAQTVARFRISNQSWDGPVGQGGWGETEDHVLTIECPVDLSVEMEFDPDPGSDGNRIQLDENVYRGKWELSHPITITTFVKNNESVHGARQMQVTVKLPTEIENPEVSAESDWACAADPLDSTQWICSKYGLEAGMREPVLTFTGRIAGTFPLDSVDGAATVWHEGREPFGASDNNHVEHEIEVLKQWEGQEVAIPYIYAQFADVLSEASSSDILSREIEIGDRLASPLQVPIFIGVGIDTSLYDPILRTRLCHDAYEDNEEFGTRIPGGCRNASDYITGTVAIESHTTLTLTQMVKSVTGSYMPGPSANNHLRTRGPVTSPISNSEGLRYVADSVSKCEYWVDALGGGECLARQAFIDRLDPSEKEIFEWKKEDLTPISFQTNGGRPISCDGGASNCIYISEASPGVYQVQGYVTYQVIFIDPDHNRLNKDTPPYKHVETRNPAISFYLQQIYSPIEPDTEFKTEPDE